MTRRNQKRHAFTLVELLVVIAIIVVLTALLMSGVAAVRIRQQERTTEDIVYKLQMGIENQRKALVDQALADRKNRTPDYVNLVAYCDNDEDRAQALLVYLKLRHAFPQTYSEATTPVVLMVGATPYINWPPHKAYATLPILSSGWSAHEQSAAILFVGLSNLGTGGNVFATDDATASAQIDYIPLGATVAARVFKDARGNPVGFRRFWQSDELNRAPYTNVKPGKSLDPFDPVGKLATATAVWANGATGRKGIAEAAVFVPGNNQTFDSFANNKSITAYSLGQDKLLNTADDVLGYRLLKQGNKGAP